MACAETCGGVSWDEYYQPNVQRLNTLYDLKLVDFDSFDWCIFDDVDVVADVPISQLTPYIYAAYGPGTKVINTVRNASSWVARRAEWDIEWGKNDTAPLGWIFGPSIGRDRLPGMSTSASGLFNRSHTADTFAYIAERALLHCTVEPADLLELSIVDDPIEPRSLWKSLSDFVGIPTTGLDTNLFPHEVPNSCHSDSVLATYHLVSNLTYDPGNENQTFSRDDYKIFYYRDKSEEIINDLLGCAPTIAGGGTRPFGRSIDANWRRIFQKTAEGVISFVDPFCAGSAITSPSCKDVVQSALKQTTTVHLNSTAVSELTKVPTMELVMDSNGSFLAGLLLTAFVEEEEITAVASSAGNALPSAPSAPPI